MMTPDADDELRELRRRAYGPEAPGLSSAELDRLEHLETRSRTPAPKDGSASESSPAPTDPAPIVEAPPASVIAAAAASEPVLPDAAVESTTVVRSKRWIPWVAAVGGVAVGVALTLGVTSFGERAPDATQRPIDTVPLPSFGYTFSLEMDTLRSYEPWNRVALWTVRRADGATCIAIGSGDIDEAGGQFGTVQCTQSGLDPQLDFSVWAGLGDMLGIDLPADSSVRFVARNGVVDVWVDPAGDATES